jgi:uncharacterized protein with ParB-like and HNH nuclease domain
MKTSVQKVSHLFQQALNIPIYQRPYRWSEKHLSQLIQDIIHHQDKSSYRLGTIVVHVNDKGNTLDIVDGQQRLLSLALIVTAIQKRLPKSELFEGTGFEFLTSLAIKNEISVTNLKHNSVIVKQRLLALDPKALEAFAKYLLEHCTVVYIVLNDLSEAFQFFDSQNARGKALEPYDLLKAYHLREMDHESEHTKTEIIQRWEEHAKSQGPLKNIFDDFLFRIRKWLKYEQGRYFTKDEIDLFKGLNPDDKNLPPYFALYRFSHHLTDNYNQDDVRKIDEQLLEYPFALDQVMLNGRRFFEFVDHYVCLSKKIQAHPDLSPFFNVKDYKGKSRKGDQYTLNLFRAALLFYVDKFGECELEQAGKICFLWAYKLRLTKQAVQLAGMDNYALQDDSLFKVINNAIHAKDVCNYIVKPINKLSSTKTTGVEAIFIENGVLTDGKS